MDPNTVTDWRLSKLCQNFQRNTPYFHVRHKAQILQSQRIFAEKKVVDESFPGDIVGLHDTGNLRLGIPLPQEEMQYKGIPSFRPNIFALSTMPIP